MDLNQFPHKGEPIDAALAGWKMFVAVTLIVMDMQHPQVGSQFVNEAIKIARKKSMSGVETPTDLRCL